MVAIDIIKVFPWLGQSCAQLYGTSVNQRLTEHAGGAIDFS